MSHKLDMYVLYILYHVFFYMYVVCSTFLRYILCCKCVHILEYMYLGIYCAHVPHMYFTMSKCKFLHESMYTCEVYFKKSVINSLLSFFHHVVYCSLALLEWRRPECPFCWAWPLRRNSRSLSDGYASQGRWNIETFFDSVSVVVLPRFFESRIGEISGRCGSKEVVCSEKLCTDCRPPVGTEYWWVVLLTSSVGEQERKRFTLSRTNSSW